jgi:hypothetical protein
MRRKKKGAPVVIVRKDKRLNKLGHLTAFALTGGASGVYSAAKAATNAGYNARTRKLMEAAEGEPEPSADSRFAEAGHEAARERGREAMTRLNPRQAENEQVAEGLSAIARMQEEKLKGGER